MQARERQQEMMEWEKERYNCDQQQLILQDDRNYSLEQARLEMVQKEKNDRLALEQNQLALERDKFERSQKEKAERMSHVVEWIQQGKSTAEIGKLVKMIYGS